MAAGLAVAADADDTVGATNPATVPPAAASNAALFT